VVTGTSCFAHSGARPRTTTTRWSSASSDTTSRRKTHRRSIGSMRVRCRSGLANARGIPGRPAPDPTSATRSSASRASVSTALLSRCRSQIRWPSRGPSRPRWVPLVTRSSANLRAKTSRSPNRACAPGRQSGGGSGVDRASDTSRHSYRHSSGRRLVVSGGEHDDAALRLFALAFARHPLDRRYGVVDDLALERAHR